MNDKDSNIDPRELLAADLSDVNDSENVQVSCTLVLELLPEAIGGDLDEQTLAIVARHVADCQACAKEWISLRKAYESLQVLRESSSQTPGLDAAFFDELHTDIIGEIRHQAQQVHDARKIQGAKQLAKATPPATQFSSRVASVLPKLVALAAAVLLGVFLGSMNDATESGTIDPGNPHGSAGFMSIDYSDADAAFREQVWELRTLFDESSRKRKEASKPKSLTTPPAGDDH